MSALSRTESDEIAAPEAVPRRAFFARATETVARDLLGMWLLRDSDDGPLAGRIVEVEAYCGPDDRASHARAGRTARTAPMYGEVGHAYVYLVYGMHYCLNVVAYASPAVAGAVLLRAIEPLIGIEAMRRRRGRAIGPDAKLTGGPARVCQALDVDRALDGHDLTLGQRLWLSEPPDASAATVTSGRRIGVDYAGDEWAAKPWRFWLAGHPSVSR